MAKTKYDWIVTGAPCRTVTERKTGKMATIYRLGNAYIFTGRRLGNYERLIEQRFDTHPEAVVAAEKWLPKRIKEKAK